VELDALQAAHAKWGERVVVLTAYDVLIIASVVEKETLSPGERQLAQPSSTTGCTRACRLGSTRRCATA
jgi:hypothetical protein